MSPIKSFRDLDVWRLSMDLVDLILPMSRRLPGREFDLRRQICDAATSIPSNVAEGWRRKKRRGAYQNHVSIAMGSQGEVETRLEIAFRNGFLNRGDCTAILELLDRFGAIISRLHDSLDG
jgi:four helix bundle protein